MNPNTFPTKGNLILAKNSLALATQGYGLMDKKRNILLRELMGLINEAKSIQSEIDATYAEAYTVWRRWPCLFPWRIPSASKPEALWARRSLWSSMNPNP